MLGMRRILSYLQRVFKGRPKAPEAPHNQVIEGPSARKEARNALEDEQVCNDPKLKDSEICRPKGE